jgi:hypothetical protein
VVNEFFFSEIEYHDIGNIRNQHLLYPNAIGGYLDTYQEYSFNVNWLPSSSFYLSYQEFKGSQLLFSKALTCLI